MSKVVWKGGLFNEQLSISSLTVRMMVRIEIACMFAALVFIVASVSTMMPA